MVIVIGWKVWYIISIFSRPGKGIALKDQPRIGVSWYTKVFKSLPHTRRHHPPWHAGPPLLPKHTCPSYHMVFLGVVSSTSQQVVSCDQSRSRKSMAVLIHIWFQVTTCTYEIVGIDTCVLALPWICWIMIGRKTQPAGKFHFISPLTAELCLFSFSFSFSALLFFSELRSNEVFILMIT